MLETIRRIQMRDAFIEKLFACAQEDKDIIFISNEYGAPSLDRFRAELPDQFINAGISEQNLISVAAGMALEGKRPYVYSIASFITLRCFEQIKLDVCVHDVPVCIVGVGTCYAYSEDGPSHHATEDIALMRVLPNMTIYSPSDSCMAKDLVSVTNTIEGPSYIRFDRSTVWEICDKGEHAIDDGLRTVREGADVCLIATGVMVDRALELADLLSSQGISAKVIDVFRLKPLPDTLLCDQLRNFKNVLSIEEHTIMGGLGSIIAELVCDFRLSCRLTRVSVLEDNLFAYGKRETLHKKNGLDIESLSNRVRKVLEI